MVYLCTLLYMYTCTYIIIKIFHVISLNTPSNAKSFCTPNWSLEDTLLPLKRKPRISYCRLIIWDQTMALEIFYSGFQNGDEDLQVGYEFRSTDLAWFISWCELLFIMCARHAPFKTSSHSVLFIFLGMKHSERSFWVIKTQVLKTIWGG